MIKLKNKQETQKIKELLIYITIIFIDHSNF